MFFGKVGWFRVSVDKQMTECWFPLSMTACRVSQVPINVTVDSHVKYESSHVGLTHCHFHYLSHQRLLWTDVFVLQLKRDHISIMWYCTFDMLIEFCWAQICALIIMLSGLVSMMTGITAIIFRRQLCLSSTQVGIGLSFCRITN